MASAQKARRNAASKKRREERILLAYCPVFHNKHLPPDAGTALLSACPAAISDRDYRGLRDVVEVEWCRAWDRYGLDHDPAVCLPLLVQLARRISAGTRLPLPQLRAKLIANLRGEVRFLPQRLERIERRAPANRPTPAPPPPDTLEPLEWD